MRIYLRIVVHTYLMLIYIICYIWNIPIYIVILCVLMLVCHITTRENLILLREGRCTIKMSIRISVGSNQQ